MCSFLCIFLGSKPFFCICWLPVFSLLWFSAPQLLLDKLRSFNDNVLLLCFLISSWFHQSTFSRRSVYLVMTHITPWSVNFRYIHLYFLTSNIVTILILDRASLFYASPSCPTLEEALDQAYSQYKSSDTHNTVKEQFLLPLKQYSISQLEEFVLSHRLRWLLFAFCYSSFCLICTGFMSVNRGE